MGLGTCLSLAYSASYVTRSSLAQATDSLFLALSGYVLPATSSMGIGPSPELVPELHEQSKQDLQRS